MFLTLANAGLAHPPEAPGSPEAAIETGKAALSDYDRGNLESAVLGFERAESLAHSPVFGLHIARCQRRLGRLADARRTYESVAAEHLASDAPPPWRNAVAAAKTELRELQASVSAAGASDEHAPAAADAARSATVPTTMEPVQESPPRSAQPRETAASARREVIGTVSLAVGLAGLAVGAVAGIVAANKAAAVDCPNDVCSLSQAPQVNAAEQWADIATVGFIFGGAATAAGLTVLIALPANDGPRSYGVQVSTRF